MSRKRPVRVLFIHYRLCDNLGMETILKRLIDIGIASETIEAIRAANDDKAMETALILLAQFDDRHEYVD